MKRPYALVNLADVAAAAARTPARSARECWPRPRLEAWQQERLGALVEHASTHSAFYRRHYGGRIDRRDVRLAALPPVTKAMMMDHLDAFVTDRRLTRDVLERHLASIGTDDELLFGAYRVMASGGSSGRKGIYVYDRGAWRGVLGGAMRWTRMMGVAPRFPRRRRMAQIAAPDAKHMTRRGASSLGAVGLFEQLGLSATRPVGELVAALNARPPEVLTGYPSVLALLAVEQIEGRLRIAPAVVCTTSEVRTDEMAARIRAAWQIEPFDSLGLTETGITAVDCPEHRGLHLFEDATIFEVVDEHDRPVPAGRPGHKVLVTNLDNRTQPFIRFEVTDLVTVADDPCPCGRTFRRVTAIEGRSDDILELPTGAGGTVPVHPIHLRSALAAMPAIAQYQIVQQVGRLDVTLALAAGAAPETVARAVERALAAKLAELGVAGVTIAAAVVPCIDREAGAGKFKLIKAMPGGAGGRVRAVG